MNIFRNVSLFTLCVLFLSGVNAVASEGTTTSQKSCKKLPDSKWKSFWIRRGGNEKIFYQKHKKQCEELLKSKPELVFIGDSITEGWDRKVLNSKLKKYKPGMMGIGGDWMQGALWRVENGVLDQITPKAVVLLIGTNNVTARYSVDEVVEGNQAIIKAIKEKSPDTKVVLMGLFPRGKSPLEDKRYLKCLEINKKLKELADGKEVICLEVNDKMFEPDGKTVTPGVMKKDNLHFLTKGYEIWSDTLIPALDKIYPNDSK